MRAASELPKKKKPPRTVPMCELREAASTVTLPGWRLIIRYCLWETTTFGT